jgi:hypothetical protein
MAGPALKGPQLPSVKANFSIAGVFHIFPEYAANPGCQAGSLAQKDYVKIIAFPAGTEWLSRGWHQTVVQPSKSIAGAVALLWQLNVFSEIRTLRLEVLPGCWRSSV